MLLSILHLECSSRLHLSIVPLFYLLGRSSRFYLWMIPPSSSSPLDRSARLFTSLSCTGQGREAGVVAGSGGGSRAARAEPRQHPFCRLPRFPVQGAAAAGPRGPHLIQGDISHRWCASLATASCGSRESHAGLTSSEVRLVIDGLPKL